MQLRWVEIRDFRNHRERRVEPSTGLTVVVGPNAEGKTNLLEAIHYLCSLESPRVSSDLPLVRIDGERPVGSAFLRGEVESAGGRTLIEVEVRAGGQNRVQVNRSSVRRKRDVRRHVRAVFSTPDDLRIVQGEPDDRRRFMDEAVRALWPLRDTATSAYERVLRQRNRLLKDWGGVGEPPALAGWDAELVSHGVIVTALRRRAVAMMAGAAAQEFATLVGHTGETLAVRYRPSVEAETESELDEVFRARLAERRADELVRRTTLVGPHRDDLELKVQGLATRGFASHGEAWGAAMSLRLALARAVAAEIGEPPVLLLDDPFSALDPARRRRLGDALGGRGQVVIAIPDESQLPGGASVWHLRGGELDTR